MFFFTIVTSLLNAQYVEPKTIEIRIQLLIFTLIHLQIPHVSLLWNFSASFSFGGLFPDYGRSVAWQSFKHAAFLLSDVSLPEISLFYCGSRQIHRPHDFERNMLQ